MTIHQRRCQRLMRVSIPVPEGAGPRACLEAQISLLISLLDHLDPDPDLEETGDFEPSLGAYTGIVDGELDPSDTEPSLGSFGCINQEGWAGRGEEFSVGTDRELDDCDDEDGGDTEANGDELDGPDDNGIGDEDGLHEQVSVFDEADDRWTGPSRPYEVKQEDARKAREAAQQLGGIVARLGGQATVPARRGELLRVW